MFTNELNGPLRGIVALARIGSFFVVSSVVTLVVAVPFAVVWLWNHVVVRP